MMLEIRKLLNARLKAIHPRVYFLRAPESAVFPYLVYEFEITDLGEGLQLLTLDVDGWDNRADTTELENLMTAIKNRFNRSILIDDKQVINFYLDRQFPLVDNDPSLNRRKYIYQGRLFER